MKFTSTESLKGLADFLECKWVGQPDMPVTGLNEIHRVEEGDIVFVDHPKYYQKALESRATVVLINQEVDCPEGKGLLVMEKPFDGFNRLISQFRPHRFDAQDAIPPEVGEDTFIAPQVYIGNRVRIGRNCVIHPHVVLHDDVCIGDRVIVQSGTVLGSEAFYYKNQPEGYRILHSCGDVVLEDDVEIGAQCTIDRGVTATTRIGKGTKIDNLVQVGHDTLIGANCLIAAQCGIAGCVEIGNGVTLWGQVGVKSGIEIGDGAICLAQTGVAKSLKGGETYFGSPAEPARNKMKQIAFLRRQSNS